MDEDHLAAAYRYVNLNPVRACLVDAGRRLARGRARAPFWASPRTALPISPRPASDFPASPTSWKPTRTKGRPRACAKAKASAGRSVRRRSSPRWKPRPAAASTPSSAGPSQRTTERPRPRSKMPCHRYCRHRYCHFPEEPPAIRVTREYHPILGAKSYCDSLPEKATDMINSPVMAVMILEGSPHSVLGNRRSGNKIGRGKAGMLGKSQRDKRRGPQ